MTTAKFKVRGNEFDIKISGHAGFNPGNDIVCAGQSTLVYTLIQCMRAEHEGGAFVTYTDEIDEKDGYFHMRAEAKEGHAEYIDAMVTVIASGFALLANKYTNYIRFKYTRDPEPIATVQSEAVN